MTSLLHRQVLSVCDSSISLPEVTCADTYQRTVVFASIWQGLNVIQEGAPVMSAFAHASEQRGAWEAYHAIASNYDWWHIAPLSIFRLISLQQGP